jgi:hypothetical protein
MPGRPGKRNHRKRSKGRSLGEANYHQRTEKWYEKSRIKPDGSASQYLI